MTVKASLAQNSIERFRQRTQNKTLLAADYGSNSVEQLQHIPLNFLRRAECRANMRNVSDELRAISAILSVSENWDVNSENESESVEARVRQVAQVILQLTRFIFLKTSFSWVEYLIDI